MGIEKIVNSFSKLGTDTISELIFGTIITLNPLSIKINDKDTLSEEFFFLGQMCRPHKVTIPHGPLYKGITEIDDEELHTHTYSEGETGEGGTGGHTHEYEGITEDVHPNTEFVTLEIYPKLEIGDIVVLFSFNKGQKYYVAERIENDSANQ